MQIIIKKLHKALDVLPSTLTFGDCRTQMKADLLKSLEEILNRKANYGQVYFILVYAHVDPAIPGGRAIKERILILPEKPQRLLGTICFRIDPVGGDATIEWVLPLDIPTPAILHTEAGNHRRVQGAATIMESVKGMPIINRGMN